MSELLEALQRADQALQDVKDIEDKPSSMWEDAATAQKKMKYHLKDLERYLFEKEVKRMNEWNRSFQYAPRHQEEMKIP